MGRGRRLGLNGARWWGWSVWSSNPGRQLRDRHAQLAGHLNAGQMVAPHELGVTLGEGRAGGIRTTAARPRLGIR